MAASDERDYYADLGVASTATDAEIKAAYRRMATKWHPDHNSGDKKAEDKFKMIAKAYAVLADPDQKKAYDESRRLADARRRREPDASKVSDFEDALRRQAAAGSTPRQSPTSSGARPSASGPSSARGPRATAPGGTRSGSAGSGAPSRSPRPAQGSTPHRQPPHHSGGGTSSPPPPAPAAPTPTAIHRSRWSYLGPVVPLLVTVAVVLFVIALLTQSSSPAGPRSQRGRFRPPSFATFGVSPTFRPAARVVRLTQSQPDTSIAGREKVSIRPVLSGFELQLHVSVSYTPVAGRGANARTIAGSCINLLTASTSTNSGDQIREGPLASRLSMRGKTVSGVLTYAGLMPGVYSWDPSGDCAPNSNGLVIGNMTTRAVGTTSGGSDDYGVVLFATRQVGANTVLAFGEIGQVGGTPSVPRLQASCITGDAMAETMPNAVYASRVDSYKRGSATGLVNGETATYLLGTMTFPTGTTGISGKEFAPTCNVPDENPITF
jgi:hypothetical protein